MLNRVASMPGISNICHYVSDRKVAHKNWSDISHRGRARIIMGDVQLSSAILGSLGIIAWLAILIASPSSSALENNFFQFLPLVGTSGSLMVISSLSMIGSSLTRCCESEKKVEKIRRDTL